MRGTLDSNKRRSVVLDNVSQLPEHSHTLGFGKRFDNEGKLWDNIAIRGIRFAFANDIPDSGQEHAVNGSDGFHMPR